jgi:IclR family pca regulon transcriptional regulator
MPAHAVTPGVMMLAALDDAPARRLDRGSTTSSASPPTPSPTRHAVPPSMREARALDCWITGQQLDFGLRGLAVPLKDRKGACHGAMGMIVQTQSYSDEQMQVHLLPLLREAAQAAAAAAVTSAASLPYSAL